MTLPWKTEYLDDCTTAVKYVVSKVGLYSWESDITMEIYFLDKWTWHMTVFPS